MVHSPHQLSGPLRFMDTGESPSCIIERDSHTCGAHNPKTSHNIG